MRRNRFDSSASPGTSMLGVSETISKTTFAKSQPRSSTSPDFVYTAFTTAANDSRPSRQRSNKSKDHSPQFCRTPGASSPTSASCHPFCVVRSVPSVARAANGLPTAARRLLNQHDSLPRCWPADQRRLQHAARPRNPTRRIVP